MNRQETYDKIRDHLMNQGRKSEQDTDDPDYRGMYRGPDGLMCAVGCLIPDGMYSRDMEGRVACQLPDDVLNAIGAKTESDRDWLTELQKIHDGNDPGAWPVLLYRFAIDSGLRP